MPVSKILSLFHLSVKEIYKERGIKDCDHELVKKAFEKEEEKVLRKFNITKIIYDTYVKELDRFYKAQEAERLKREQEEAKRIADAEREMEQEMLMQEEEKRRQQSLIRRQQAAQKRANKGSRVRKSMPSNRDVMGMNSPKKQRPD